MHAIEDERIGVGPRTNELSQASEPWPALPPKIELAAVPSEAGDIVGGQRTGADGAHVTSEDVDELRDLIETSGTKQPAQTCNPAVAHRAELQDTKRFAAMTKALLTEKDRPAVLSQNGKANGDHDRSEHHQPR